MTLAPGDEFAGYTIEAVLGTGGMGAVYLAKHPRLPRRDALKLLNPVYSADAGFRARFEREADLAAGLMHRNIVAVYDRGSVDGQLWIAMQYVRGTDAAVAMRADDGSAGDGSMTPERVVHIVSEVGAGLDYAHRAGLLHRDVKPANILLAPPDAPGEPEHVLLTDFGIAKSTDEVQHLTGTGNLLATLAYASPEQIEAKPLDHRVDIYALGCVMYELLTGSVPFAGETPFATMRAHLHQPPPRPSAKVPGLPPALDDVVVTAMAKDREERYSSCRKLSLAARAALTEVVAESSTPPTPPEVTPVGPGEFRQAAPDVAPEPEAVREPVVSLTAPRPPFVIHLRRSGPAGVAELGPVPTDRLPATERIRIEELVHRARFFELPERLPLEYVVPGDVFEQILVSSEKGNRAVGYERRGARHPVELDELIGALERLAPWRPGLPQGGHQVSPQGGHQVRPQGPPPLGPPTVATTAGFPPPGAPPQHVAPPGPPTVATTAGFPPPGAPSQHVAPPGPPQHVGASSPAQPSGSDAASSRSRRLLIVAVIAVVAVIAAGTTIYFLTRPSSGPVVGASASVTASTNLTAQTTPTTETTEEEPATDDPATASGTVLPSWTDLEYMLADFPDMLPASPDATGYADASCGVAEDTASSGADGIISCLDPAGRYWEVLHFPDQQTRDAYVARDWSGAVQEPWHIDDVVQGTIYRSPDDEATLPFVLTTFDSAQRQQYLLYAHWSDHTTAQLIDEWWQPAPF